MAARRETGLRPCMALPDDGHMYGTSDPGYQGILKKLTDANT